MSKLNAAFWKWFGKSKVVDANGEPLVVYHGTTHDFNEFKLDRSNIENHFGRGFYFSNNPDDIDENYAGEGPDLTSRIERQAEQVFDEKFGDKNYQYGSSQYKKAMEKAKNLARKALAGKAPIVLPCYLRIENPIFIQPKGGTRFDYEMEFEDDDPDHEGEPIGETGSAVNVMEAIKDVVDGWGGDGSTAVGDIQDKLGELDGTTARALDKALRESEALMYLEADNGDLASTEVIRKIYERAGYDGIIQDAYAEFGYARKTGKPMVSVTPGTFHYIVFKPNQIKSATGNDGSWDYNDADIRSNPRRR